MNVYVILVFVVAMLAFGIQQERLALQRSLYLPLWTSIPPPFAHCPPSFT